MGCWDIFCPICGNTCHNYGKYMKERFETLELEIPPNVNLKNIEKKMKWLEKCTMLLSNNEVIHDCEEVSCNIDFVNRKNKMRIVMNGFEPRNYFDGKFYLPDGLFLHTDCWKYVKKNYGIELKFKDLPFIANIRKQYPIKYGEIEKYWAQDTEYEKMIIDKKIYMAYSPLDNTNVKNISRINKIISQFKLKKDRKGPSISASFCKTKDIRLGNNKKFWMKTNGKWNEIKEDVIVKKYNFKKEPKRSNKINKIPQSGESNKIPLFINKVELVKKEIVLEVIGTEKTIEFFEKLL